MTTFPGRQIIRLTTQRVCWPRGITLCRHLRLLLSHRRSSLWLRVSPHLNPPSASSWAFYQPSNLHADSQGVISVILTMNHFLERFPEIDGVTAGSGFYKGLMTAMITLGAAFGAVNQGWMADAFSRKYTIVFAVVVFTFGSVLQVAAVDYDMLVVARLFGGIGIGL